MFYLPGVALLYSVALFIADFAATGDYSIDYLVGTFAFFGIAAFLIMLGIGKLKNLEYLQVVAAVAITSFTAELVRQILERKVLPRGYDLRVDYDYRNLIVFLIPVFLLIAAFVGILAKRRLDREEAGL